jgi:hypothetical protein
MLPRQVTSCAPAGQPARRSTLATVVGYHRLPRLGRWLSASRAAPIWRREAPAACSWRARAIAACSRSSGTRARPAGAVAERRRPVGEATTGGLRGTAAAQPQRDHGPLVLRHRTENLADQPPRGILGIVMEVRLPTDGREQLPGPPHLSQQLLLEDQVAGEPVEPVDDDRAGPAVLHRSQGLGQPEPVLELLGPRHTLIAEHGQDVVAVLSGPGPAGLLLVDQAQALLDRPYGWSSLAGSSAGVPPDLAVTVS